jgi:hypothetical protein
VLEVTFFREFFPGIFGEKSGKNRGKSPPKFSRISEKNLSKKNGVKCILPAVTLRVRLKLTSKNSGKFPEKTGKKPKKTPRFFCKKVPNFAVSAHNPGFSVKKRGKKEKKMRFFQKSGIFGGFWAISAS